MHAPPAWLDTALQGHRASLARAVTSVEEDDADAAAVLQAASMRLGHALVVGFTGSPGAGKSTLIGACIAQALGRGLSVAVVAVDPSSPLTGGSVLGDRIRMLPVASDPRVYVRSLSARGHLGGLSVATAGVVDVLDAAGKDLILIESVGVGQSETDVSRMAHVTVLVCAPGLGDEVQLLKAGVLEVADVFAVNKSDLPEGQRLVRQLEAAAHLGTRPVHVVATSAVHGSGVGELLDTVLSTRRLPAAEERLRRMQASLQARALRLMGEHLATVQQSKGEGLSRAVLAGEMPLDAAAQALIGAALHAGL